MLIVMVEAEPMMKQAVAVGARVVET